VGASTDELEQALIAVRADAEEKVLLLRGRARHTARTVLRRAGLVAGVSAVAGATALSLLMLRRYRHRPNLARQAGEEISRARARWARLHSPVRVRVSAGREKTGAPKHPAYGVAWRLAGSLGTALGTALATALARRLTQGRPAGRRPDGTD